MEPRTGSPASRLLRVLLVEDNPFSQKVALFLLQQAGHSVTIVENGRKAIEAIAGGNFELVLMDIQMPEMNGFEATAAIRSREGGTERRLPIVALTADSRLEERAHCLAAGMDVCLSKPIRLESLRWAIEVCMHAGSDDVADDMPPDDSGFPIDEVAALQRVGGDRSFLGELVAMFLEESPGLIAQIREALSQGDVRSLVTPAHNLKNWASNFGAEATYAALTQLEASGRAGTLDSALATFRELERAFDLLTRALIRFDPMIPEGDVAV